MSLCPTETTQSDTLTSIAQQLNIPLRDLLKAIGVYFTGVIDKHVHLINVQKGNGEDVFNEPIEPVLDNGTLRFFVVTSSGTPSLDVTITTDEAENLTAGVLSDANLVVDRGYTFDVPSRRGWKYNLRASADTTWKLILVQELSA